MRNVPKKIGVLYDVLEAICKKKEDIVVFPYEHHIRYSVSGININQVLEQEK